MSAYQQLVEAGCLVSKERNGYYVNNDIVAGRIRCEAPRRTASEPVSDWNRRLQIHLRGQRNISKALDWHIFVYGQFDPELFPVSEVAGMQPTSYEFDPCMQLGARLHR